MNFVREVTQISKVGENMKQVIWFPLVYWEIALKDSPQVTPEALKMMQDIFKDYEVFLALDINLNPFGIQKNDIKTFTLKVNEKEIKPVEDYPSDLSSILSYVKPMFKQMLGQMGESMEIFVFENRNNTIPLPYTKNEFFVTINEKVFRYRLPIAELVLKKTCPSTNEKMNGSWEYCPWCGSKLN